MNPKKAMIAVFVCFFSIYSYGQKLVEVWRTGPKMKTPESVLYAPEEDVIFVANINGNPTDKDGNGFISQLNTDGSIKKMEWLTGLDAPKGMAVSNGKLYVADIDQLVEIDIADANIAKRYPAPGAVFLNDVAVSADGMVFVSDSRTNKIHALDNGQFSVWKDSKELDGINGLYTEAGKLFVRSGKIQEIDIKTKQTKDIQDDCGGIDGLAKDQEGNFVFSNWAGRIFYLEDGKMQKLWDTTDEKINTVDLFFAGKPNLLLVPTFFDNQVIAFRIKK